MDFEQYIEYLRWLRKKKRFGEFEERLNWTGLVTIKVYDKNDRCVGVWQKKNLITNAGKNFIRDSLKSATSTDMKIKYVALGSSSTAPAGTQTMLIAEQFRKAITQQTAGGTGALTTTGFIAAAEATSFTIQELGWFAGSSATSSPNTGTMIARVLYSRTKSSLESLEIDRTDTFS